MPIPTHSAHAARLRRIETEFARDRAQDREDAAHEAHQEAMAAVAAACGWLRRTGRLPDRIALLRASEAALRAARRATQAGTALRTAMREEEDALSEQIAIREEEEEQNQERWVAHRSYCRRELSPSL